jgi:hypothetical protein
MLLALQEHARDSSPLTCFHKAGSMAPNQANERQNMEILLGAIAVVCAAALICCFYNWLESVEEDEWPQPPKLA